MADRLSSPSRQPESPLLAIVGRPNVGKSTLFNRLVGRRQAIVEDEPGVTRDRRYALASWGAFDFRVVDTGGLDPDPPTGLVAAVRAQVLQAVAEADAILLVVDARQGLTAGDREVARLLRRRGRPVLCVANKVDSGRQVSLAAEGYELGLGEVFAVSASHGHGFCELCEAIVAALASAPAQAENGGEAGGTGDAGEEAGAGGASEAAGAGGASEAADAGGASEAADAGGASDTGAAADAGVAGSEEAPLALALVGKPNVGKSSLVNRLLGEQRVVVDAMPGTTRDPIDSLLLCGDHRYLLIDTAGIRRRRSIDQPAEAVSVMMAMRQIERASVVLLVLDASAPCAEQDARIAGLIEEHRRAAVILLNKCDLLGGGEAPGAAGRRARPTLDGSAGPPGPALRARVRRLREELPFLDYLEALPVSAYTGDGVRRILPAVEAAYAAYSRRIATAELNRFLEAALAHCPPPADRGRAVRIYYVTQAQARPPTFVLSVNHPEAIRTAYRRYLGNRLREQFGFTGAPLRLICRRKPGGHRRLGR